MALKKLCDRCSAEMHITSDGVAHLAETNLRYATAPTDTYVAGTRREHHICNACVKDLDQWMKQN